MTDKQQKVHHREPLIHIAKRDDMSPWLAWLIRIAAILLAILLLGVISVALTEGEQDLGEIYNTMVRGAFGQFFKNGSTKLLWSYLQRVAVLLCLGLAVTPAFKMKFWNCGAEGQALMGGLAAMLCMIHLSNLPYPLLLIAVIVSSILAGALWGFIPAIFKAQYNTNETLFTLMMNYVATQIVSYYVYLVGQGSGVIQPVSTGNLPIIGNNKQLLNILIVVVVMLLMFVYLKYSKQGYEISVVGESQNTARYVGINVKKVILRTMIISGAVCGVAGMLLVSGIDHSVNADTIGGQGFTAIMVSWLGQFNPFIIALMSALIVFLELGAGKVADSFRLNSSYADVATGIVILFLVGCEFFIRYSIKFRRAKKEGTV